MKIKQLLLFVCFLTIPFANYSQQWHQYSDSIMANIQKNNLAKASRFVELADAEMKGLKVNKDTIYADFLYRKDIVNYFQTKKIDGLLNESLLIWDTSNKKNYFKIMKIHYFLGKNYISGKKYDLAISSFETCYEINKKYKIKVNSNIIEAIYLLAALYNDKENTTKATKFADDYIALMQSNAYFNFNFDFANAYKFKKDVISQEKVLLKFLSLYNDRKLNDSNLLFKINFELFHFYSLNENIPETIKYGEKAFEIQQSSNLKAIDELKVIFSSLINKYGQIGDNINQNKYRTIKDKYFPTDDNNIDYFDELDKLIVKEDFDGFMIKFKDYEDNLILKNNYNDLLFVYALSLSLCEMNILFNKDDIAKQMRLIEDNQSLLFSENKLWFDLFLAEYYLLVEGDYGKAYQITKKNINIENVDLRLKLLGIKVFCENLLGIKSAIDSASKVFDFAKKTYGDGAPQLLPYYQLLIEINSAIDNAYKSTVLASESLKIIYDNKLENTQVASILWSTLAKASAKNQDTKTAIYYYNKALKILDSNKVITNPLNYLSTLLGLSESNMLENNREESSKYLLRAKKYVENNKVLSSIAMADFYLYEGNFYFNNDQFIKAKESFEKAFSFYAEKLSKPRKLEYILCDFFLNNDINATMIALEKHLKGVRSDNLLSKIIYLLKYNNGEFVASRNLLIKQLNELIDNNNKYFHLLSDYERNQIHKDFIDQFEFLNTHLLSSDDAFIKVYMNLRMYSKSLLFANSFKSDIISKNDEVHYSEYKSNVELINHYNETVTVENSKKIEELQIRNIELEKFLSAKNTSLAVPTLKDLNFKLKENEAYVEIIRINKQSKSATKKGIDIVKQFTDSIYYGAIVIKKNVAPKFIVLDDSNLLESKYFPELQNYIHGKNKLENDPTSYNLFFDKIETELNGVQKIFLVTDGIYNSINVESIYNPQKKQYVLDYLKIQLIQNVKSIIDKKKELKVNSNLKASLFGNPNFKIDFGSKITPVTKEILDSEGIRSLVSELKTKQKIAYLPGTEIEIQSLNTILKDSNWVVSLNSKSDASEDNLKKIVSPDILHIATHGFFNKNDTSKNKLTNLTSLLNNSSNPYLKSGLLLSGAQNTLNDDYLDSNNNGILSAEESKSLDLKNTELVVLSACETGLGENLVGEGVIGLQRAFMIAGAKSVIMSLWKVDDASTQKLMTLFYSNWIKSKMSKSDAFYAAKIEMKKTYPQPYYWAGFVLLE